MKLVKALLLILAFLVLAAAAAYWWAGRGLMDLDAAERARLKDKGLAHEFAALSEGTVHYRLEGPENGPVVVLVHGFSTPSFVWNAHVAPLKDAGFRVLTFDNYGRGFSDRPDGPYNAERTDRLLTELLTHLEIGTKVHLVGYSMGGAVVALHAARHPERVRSVTLIAPAGVAPLPTNAQLDTLRLPLLGDWLVRVFDKKIFYDRLAEEAEAGFAQDFARQMRYHGYPEALLSTLRHYPLIEGAPGAYETLGESGLPVLSIWAEADETVPFAHADDIRKLVPQGEVVTFPDYRHALTYTHAADVNAALLKHLEANSVRITPGGAAGKPRGPKARLDPRECDCHVHPAGVATEAPEL